MASQSTYPVRVEAKLGDDLSRWLWLVKWMLVIPHYFVLAFLWMGFFVLSVIAFFAILFTGRYPRTIFEFNVGVLRWSWRVAYYSYGALATDRYPPFTLEDVPDYPAHLEVAYPEKLSRGLVLVKWWLLAIPHYIIVGLLMGGTWLAFRGDNWQVAGFGFIGLLALVAGVILIFTGRYPTPLFDLLLGFNRWVIRVTAYAGLMTDAYPPFRLDQGGDEPGDAVTVSPSGTAARQPLPSARNDSRGTSAPTATSGWTAGPIIALVLGCLVALTSLGALSGGAVALWTDITQRQDGFVTSPTVELDTDAYAVVTEGIEIHADGPDWILPRAILGDVRVTASSRTRIFVGVARSADVERYLEGVSYSVVPNLAERDGRDLPATAGSAPASGPDIQGFWVASSTGTGTQSIRWAPSNGSWSLVVMNADASSGVDFEGDIGAEVPVLRPIAIGLLIGGGVLLLIAIAVIGGGIARAGRSNRARTVAS
jgi:hypothetical protein